MTLFCCSSMSSVLPKREEGWFRQQLPTGRRLLTCVVPAARWLAATRLALRPSSTSPSFTFLFFPCPAQFSSHSQQSVLPPGPWPTKQAWRDVSSVPRTGMLPPSHSPTGLTAALRCTPSSLLKTCCPRRVLLLRTGAHRGCAGTLRESICARTCLCGKVFKLQL